MKLFEVANQIRYINVSNDGYEDSEDDVYDIIEKAETLVKKSGMNMLRDDNITDVALVNNDVVGVLYSSTDGHIIRFSIAVNPRYRSMGIAKQLYRMIDISSESTIIAELIPPYTLEKFVLDNGFILTAKEGQFKIYSKEL